MGLGMVVYLLVPVGYLSKHSSVECVFFSGARIWLRMTFNYPVLWVRVKGQG